MIFAITVKPGFHMIADNQNRLQSKLLISLWLQTITGDPRIDDFLPRILLWLSSVSQSTDTSIDVCKYKTTWQTITMDYKQSWTCVFVWLQRAEPMILWSSGVIWKPGLTSIKNCPVGKCLVTPTLRDASIALR